MASLTRHGLPCLVRGGAGNQISIPIACVHGFGNTASGIIAPVWQRRSANDEAPAKGGVGWVDFLGRGKVVPVKGLEPPTPSLRIIDT
jgi:hypothetical protein